MPLREGDPLAGPIVWRDFTDLESGSDDDASPSALPYPRVLGLGTDEDAFAILVRAALDAGIGQQGMVGAAACHLLPTAELLAFATRWTEAHFGG